MANPAYPAGAFFKDRIKSRAIEKHEKGVDADAKLKAAYREVEDREDNRCQVTGVRLSAVSSDQRHLREHHHIKGRNIKPEWVTDPIRIVLCSKKVHDLFTGKALRVVGTDARTTKFAWNRNMVKPGKEPIRIAKEKLA